MARVRLDSGPATVLPVCDSCSWRGEATAKRAYAVAEGARHIRACHADDRRALHAADQRLKRAGRVVA